MPSDNEHTGIRFRVKPEHRDIYEPYFQLGRVYTSHRTSTADTFHAVDDNHDWVINRNLTNVVDEPEPILELHQSSIEAMWSCPRRFYLNDIVGLQLLKRPTYFTVGEIYHMGVALMLNKLNRLQIPDVQIRFDKTMSKLYNLFGAEYETEYNEATGYFNKWVTYYQDKPFTAEFVEIPLTHRQADWPEGIAIGGTLDAVILDERKDNCIWAGEWKTAQRVNVAYFRGLKNGPQPAWYYMLLIYNLQHLGLKGIDTIRGTVYEICNKSASSPTPITREAAILDQSTFTRGIEYIGKSVDRAHQLIQEDEFPRVLSSCYGKFNTECPFMPWCYRGGNKDSRFEDLLGSMFKIVPPKEALAARQTSSYTYHLGD